ncbi:PREDICTED: glucose-6-phosphatase 3 [Chaetura pelagica]|uniref:glucose-6-phosphatase 3 n=1 Tax=Chaetura pelagica TaxID=8897 RepID=UPI000523D136|nr:PREDICTED: glucose-6-phosphatase 3 [Chaetura pelagica]
MDALHVAGIRFAEVLQSGPPWLEKFWISITSLADPKCIYTTCFPLAYFLDPKVGVSVLWTGLVAEWLNVVLKWFLFGERPFWWLHESGLGGQGLLTLRQFPVSCETGPGSPSGHCMITGAALWPLVTSLMALASESSRSPFASLCRVSGSALGLGLAAQCSPPPGEPLDLRQRLLGAVLALGVLQGLHQLPQPSGTTLWYGTNFFKYTVGPWLVASLLPWFLSYPREALHNE